MLSNEITALRTLHELVASGALMEGENVNPGELATRLGLARNALENAIAVLVSEGVFESRGDGNVFVRSISKDEMRELIRFRIAIEGAVAEDLARNATPERLEPLHQEMREQRIAANTGSVALFLDHASEFHCKLAECAGFTLAEHVLRVYRNRMRMIGRQALPDRKHMEECIAEHEAVLQCVERNDPISARRTLVEHLEKTAERLRLSPAPGV